MLCCGHYRNAPKALKGADMTGQETNRPVFKTEDPSNGQPGRSYEGHSRDEAVAIARQAHAAFPSWRRQTFAERGRLMRNAAAVLRERKEEFAGLMTAEMGKVRTEGLAEIEKCAFDCDFFAEKAEQFLTREPIDMGGPKAFVTFNPLGTVLAIMPWNFPFWQVFRFAAPALMAGNVGLLKHASNVPQCALEIERILLRAGLPEGTFQTLLIGSADVEAIIADRRIAAVTLTGSEGAGASVGSIAARHIKKSVLELGGSD